MSPLTDRRKKDSSSKQPSESGVFLRLGIRSSLLLGFGTVIGVMALSILASLYLSAKFNTVVSDILASKLPATVHTFQVARAADDMAASGLSLSSLSTKKARDVAFKRIDRASATLEKALVDLKNSASNAEMIPTGLFAELEDNLRRLQLIVHERITIQDQQLEARKRLLSNLLILQRHLIYRTRILEGDGDVISRMMKRPKPPVDKVATMAVELAHLLPVARFYATVESINGHLLVASLSPTLTTLNTSRQVLTLSLSSLRETFTILPEELRHELLQPMEQLASLILSDDGLIGLRASELLLLKKITELNAVNETILERVNTATTQMVSNSQSEMTKTASSLTLLRERSMLILLLLAGLSFLGIAGLMHFYVNGQVIAQLSWLSSSMQKLAAGHLNINLPPTGPSELGRLGAALHQFRNITADARTREEALEVSNLRAQQALEALEEKTVELEIVNKKLIELSIKDPLTGLFNRRHFDETLQFEWDRAGHGDKAIALLLLDVDHFKSFNDCYGHQAGDECLKELASVFKNHARRAGDVAARYGGEEFCIICPYMDNNKAKALADNICTAVSKLKLLHKGSPFGVVTVSIGYAVAEPPYENSISSPHRLLRTADAAMYKAKNSGRNCVYG